MDTEINVSAAFEIGIVPVADVYLPDSTAIYIGQPFIFNIVPKNDIAVNESLAIKVEPFWLNLSLSAVPQSIAASASEIWGSKIGQLSFELDESNESFRRPSIAKGEILRMVKVGNRAIIFNANGIDSATPHDLHWGFEHLSDIGLLSSWALTAANEGEYWFLDTRKHLIQLNENGFKDHECSRWFDENNYVLTYDPKFKLVYISGETEGWVYDPDNQSLGKGIAGITGITPERIIVGKGELEPSPFEIQTNWYDFGSRAYKSIKTVEFSVNAKNHLEAAIDYRYANDMEPQTTPWKRVTWSGIAYIPCYGSEFRFRLRSSAAQEIHLDNIRVMGTIHGYDFLNAIGWAPNAKPST